MANLPPGIPAGHLAHPRTPPGNPIARELEDPEAQFRHAAQQQGLRDKLNAQTDENRFARAWVEALHQTVPAEKSNIASIRRSGASPEQILGDDWLGLKRMSG